jgi:very-short-patch-repair endonuclease
MGARTSTRDLLLELAATQHGLFTSAQARQAGMTPDALKAWAGAGGISRAARGVWSIAGLPVSEERRALAAVLAHRRPVALARSSAAWIWEVPGHVLGTPSVVSVRDRHHPSGSRTHSSTVLDSADTTVRNGLPVTTPTRTIFDLAGCQRPGRTARDLNNLMSRGLVTLAGLRENLDRLACRGRSGISVMRERIAALEAGEQPTESGLELRCREILRRAGFTKLDQQVVLGDDDGFIARVDFCDRARRIVFEVDSDRFHGGLLDRQIDAVKTARLESIGWTVVRITEHEIFWERDELTLRLFLIRRAADRHPPAP